MQFKGCELPMPRSPKFLAPEDLEDFDDLEEVAGRQVDTYFGAIGTVVKCRDNNHRVRVRLYCPKGDCRHWTYAYLLSNCRYAYDNNGNWLADLRDQQYVCETHRA